MSGRSVLNTLTRGLSRDWFHLIIYMPPRRRPATSPKRSSDETLPSFEPDSPIPEFSLDLDQPPELRYATLASAFRSRFESVVRQNAEIMEGLDQLSRWIPTALVLRSLPASQRAEVDALASLLHQPRPRMAMLQVVYEAFALTLLDGGTCGCTSIVVDHPDGVVHARTLDWSLLIGLESLLVNLSVFRGRDLLYRCTSIVGFVGVLTAMRMGPSSRSFHGDGALAQGGASYSLSLNYRRPFRARWTEDGVPEFDLPPAYRNYPVASALRHALLGGWPIAAFLRHVLEGPDGTCYASAKQSLLRARLLAPCYVTLAGAAAGEGCILTCDEGFGRHVQELLPQDGRPPRMGAGAAAICVANLDTFGAEADPSTGASSGAAEAPSGDGGGRGDASRVRRRCRAPKLPRTSCMASPGCVPRLRSRWCVRRGVRVRRAAPRPCATRWVPRRSPTRRRST